MPAPHFTPVADLVGPALAPDPARLDACAQTACGITADQYALAHGIISPGETVAAAPGYTRAKILDGLCKQMLWGIHQTVNASGGWRSTMDEPIQAWLHRRWQGEDVRAIRDLTAPIWYYLMNDSERRRADEAHLPEIPA